MDFQVVHAYTSASPSGLVRPISAAPGFAQRLTDTPSHGNLSLNSSACQLARLFSAKLAWAITSWIFTYQHIGD